MPRPSLFAPLLTLAIAAASGTSVAAQQYSGTSTVANEVGGVMTLSLREAGPAVTGTLSSNGLTYQLEGRVDDGVLTGALRSAEGTLFLEAERVEEELWVTLFGADAQGQPNFEDYTEIDFVAAGAATGLSGSVGSAPPEPSNPLTASQKSKGNPLAETAADPYADPYVDPYVGTFTDGNVTMRLQGGGGQYQGQVAVDGAVYPVQAQ
jgi:hypothetical protein